MENNTLFKAICVVRAASVASQKKFTSGKADFLANAVRKSAGSKTFFDFTENLMAEMDSDSAALYVAAPGQPEPPNGEKRETIPALPLAAEVDASGDAEQIIDYLRGHSKTVAALAFLPQKAFEETAQKLTLPVKTDAGKVTFGRDYRVKIRFTTLGELSHGADTKSGNTTFFRRQTILGANGRPLSVPFVSGNSIRGIVRDLLADDFLTAIGLTPNRTTPPIELWFFHALYSGGALDGKKTDNAPAEDGDKPKSKEKKKKTDGGDISDLMGKSGAIRSEGIKMFRDTFPALSALGCSFRDRILSGACRPCFGDFFPECRELGNGERSFREKLGWEFLTRREDHEGHASNSSMITQTEVIRAGAHFSGGVDYSGFATPLTKSALGRGLALLKERGYIGGANARGFGKVEFEFSNAPDPEPYQNYLAENKSKILAFMETIGAIKCL